MTTTPYSSDNGAFSDAAHKSARSSIYPLVFGTEEIAYEKTSVGGTLRHQVLDAELGIDYVLDVACGFRNPLKFTVQERFRETQWRHKQDLTITEWNPRSDKPSELYKIASDLFVYGYYSPANDRIDEAIVVQTASIKLALVARRLPFRRDSNPRTGQPFVTLRFDDLKRHAEVVMHYRVEDHDPPLDELWSDALPF